MRTRGGKISKPGHALRRNWHLGVRVLDEKSSGRQSCRSDVVRAGQSWIRQGQGGGVIDQVMSGRESPG